MNSDLKISNPMLGCLLNEVYCLSFDRFPPRQKNKTKQKKNCEHNHPASSYSLHPPLSAVLITDSVSLTRTVKTAPEVSLLVVI